MSTIGCMNFFQVVLKIILLKFLGQLCILANFKGKHVYKKKIHYKNIVIKNSYNMGTKADR